MWQVGGIIAGDVVVVDIPTGIANAIEGDWLEDGRWGVGGRHLSLFERLWWAKVWFSTTLE